MSAEILCARVINDISAQFQGLLEIRRHHGVVDDNKGIRASFVYDFRDPWNVGDLHQGVGGSLQEDETSLFGKVGNDGFRVGGVDMVGLDIVVRCQEAEQSVGACFVWY